MFLLSKSRWPWKVLPIAYLNTNIGNLTIETSRDMLPRSPTRIQANTFLLEDQWVSIRGEKALWRPSVDLTVRQSRTIFLPWDTRRDGFQSSNLCLISVHEGLVHLRYVSLSLFERRAWEKWTIKFAVQPTPFCMSVPTQVCQGLCRRKCHDRIKH
jgi:hypothetical protein